MNKVMSYQIIKPVDIDWKTFGDILYHLQRETRLAKNKTIQYFNEWQNYCEDYKYKNGKYPTPKEIYGKSMIENVFYDRLINNNTLINYINSGNLGVSIRDATRKYQSLYKDILKGDVSIPCYKSNTAIDIKGQSINNLRIKNKSYLIDLSLLSNKGKKLLKLNKGRISIILNVKDKTQKTIIDRCISGEYKICGSQILHRNKKWIFNLCYGFEYKNCILDKTKIMGVDLGVAVPAYVAFNFDKFKRNYIHDDGIIKNKLRILKDLSNAKAKRKYVGNGSVGHGTKCRMRVYKKYSNYAHNVQETKNHIWSKAIVEWAEKNGCGTIQMEDLSGFTKLHSDDKFLGQWSYYQLQQYIKYKAQEKGIDVILVNPKYTSQRCSKCGCIHKENRPKKPNQSKFKCIECGFEANADFNAARNISTPNIDQIIKEYISNNSKTDAKDMA